MRRSWIAPLVVFGMAGCGGMSDEERFSLTTPGSDDVVVREIEGSAKPPPKKVTAAEVKVIRGWANALRAGRVNQAADYFAVPSRVYDGTNPLRPLPSLNAVRQFNRGLPCGAQLVDTMRGRGWFVIATFRLTERRGPGAQPCDGAGNLALTAFLIEKRHIVQWLRQPDPISPPDDHRTS
jgi:hypothetical protein